VAAPETETVATAAPRAVEEAVETPAPASVAPKATAAPPARTSAAHTIASSSSADDDAENYEPGSLLAGPRNVQPYIPKRGEQYMSKEQLEHFRNILQTWKKDLMEEVDRTVSHMKDEAANFPDPNDRATQEEEFSLELRTRDRERKLIRKIDEALKRTEDGSYGYCLETGEEIGVKRLEARPVATLTIEAQERRERRERQYGDRDDRYR
jgi:DnaK suppressor protein